ncbi:DUF1998 domain-containing protein [Zophobihabitans entericus]|uniref:DUF1998 domain-containing protein n=1 Tax=Zophobihabitans entericus TaxID=1635327 RepID=A0A6G9IB11_9GAMM|nr:DUF1998 domain-containing protein [Zophobihabitans entericus]QIQ21009.1 DUF1998 domain-containing protein [Zophobihabitans entericus]
MAKIRKSQLITTFGPGAIYIEDSGVSILISGIDLWFKEHSDESIERYKIFDDRLANRLGVNHFRLPPDDYLGENTKGYSSSLEPLPAYRFPAWHVCNKCQRLERYPEISKNIPRCNSQNCNGKMYQVRFIAACSAGHLQEFPWREWVHTKEGLACNKTLKLETRGSSSSLSDIKVSCECGAMRSLAGMSANIGSNSCKGHMPWLGLAYKEVDECDQPLIGMLRQATNLYFPKLVSSIKIPRVSNQSLDIAINAIEAIESTHKVIIKGFLENDVNSALSIIKLAKGTQLVNIEQEVILKAAKLVFSNNLATFNLVEDEETAYRREERDILLQSCKDPLIKTSSLDMSLFQQTKFNQFFSSVTRVEKLTETRVLEGLDRIKAGTRKGDYYGTINRFNVNPDERWLPAIRVYGEGIYIEFDHQKLVDWENNNKDWLNTRLATLQKTGDFVDISQTARYILIHSFAHILINELIFECGYSSASLRERLYVSAHPEQPMSGVLIYTAAGDTEGSLGGLVSMADSHKLIPVVLKAIAKARWCSSDPICSESGSHGGQGPDSMNLAACHSCSLLPETSCENMNKLLDRRLLVSENGDNTGYFDEMLL